ncbi:MAG: hypothetical protein A4E53_00152 [Pelotomaculum sp. PtaB.Bin104]|nr:MAG: hypothetical protein A4E53_00152 [Pelotomaculum sp. PtaB.Bin104]
MAIKIVGNINTGILKSRIVSNIYMTDSEGAVEGAAYKLSSRRWTLAATTDRIYAVCRKAAGAGTDVLTQMELIKDGDILEIDYTGTPNVAFEPGLEAAVLDATGLLVNAATVSGGHLLILEKDTVNAKVKCVAIKNFGNAS